LSNGELSINSMKCLTWQCRGTPVGEEKISLCSSTFLSTCFYCIENSCIEVVVVAVTFCSPSDQIVKRVNFVVRDIILQYCFVEFNEMEVVETTSCIL
jgi:hypothetical protein